MMDRLKRQAKARLTKAGSGADILRKSGGIVNEFGKTVDDSWSVVATEKVVLSQNLGDSEQEYRSGGEFDRESPVVFFGYDSVIQDGDRVELNGILYEITSLVTYPTHKIGKAISVNGEV